MEKKLQRSAGLLLSALGAAILCFRNLITEGLYQMEIKDWVNVAVTVSGYLIAFLGVIFGAIIPLKRDSKTIDSISAQASEAQPKIQKIDDNTAKSRDLLVESVTPTLETIKERNTKIDFIANELEYQKRLKSNLSESASGRDSVLASIGAVYEENARLNEKHTQAQIRIVQLTSENKRLLEKVSSLEKSLKEERSKNRLKNNRWQDYER